MIRFDLTIFIAGFAFASGVLMIVLDILFAQEYLLPTVLSTLAIGVNLVTLFKMRDEH